MITLPQDIREVFKKARCLYTKDQVDVALDEMAEKISVKLSTENPILLCLVVGGIVPLGHLLLRLDFPLEVDYVHATRYKGGLTAGELEWRAKPTTSLKNRTVLLVDDILDTGITLQRVIDYCEIEGAKAVHTAVLVDKSDARQSGGLVEADFTGLIVANEYVFGYGMDYKEYLRNAPGIYAAAPEHS